jgi:PmbA protein
LKEQNLESLASMALETAKKMGAQDAGVRVSRSRSVSMEWRNGAVDAVQESVSRSLSLRIYADGRFSANATSDLRPKALEEFIRQCMAMTRQLEPDPFRTLPDPSLYKNRPRENLLLLDPAVSGLKAEARLKSVKELEQAARSVPGSDRIISVFTSWEDSEGESVLLHSNGFSGSHASTSIWISAETTVKDSDGKRPEEWAAAGARFAGDLPGAASVGPDSTLRALGLIGAKKIKSGVMPVIIENRAAGRISSALMGGPLSGSSLQQKRSFLEGKAGQKVGSDKLTVRDNPLVKKGFGSRLFDGEGISSKKMPVFEKGVLKNYYIDTYYGKKLGMPPTTGGLSNLDWALGKRGLDAIIKSVKEGVLVTSFLGGNSNDTTGDFSLGIRGFYIKDGARVHPIAEMNITGNHMELWKNLVETGNDPYPWSVSRVPTLLFEGVHVSGE